MELQIELANFEPKRSPTFGVYHTPGTVYNVVKTIVKRKATVFGSLAEWVKNGIDVSKWNGLMNWAVTGPMIDFAYIRGGYGWTRDIRLDENKAGCTGQNKPYGLYWFLYVGSDMSRQLDAFVDTLEEGGWILPPVADFESTTLDAASTTAWIEEFMSRLQNRVPVKLMIYTSPGWWNTHVKRNTWARKYWLWVAHWTSADTYAVPYDWTREDVLFWQWSADGNGKGREYGSVDGDWDMDLNRFTKDLAAWSALVNGADTGGSDPAPVEGYTVLGDGLLVRGGPWTTYASIGSRKAGDVVNALDYNLWIKDARGWSAVRHLGKNYMEKGQ